MIKFCPSIGFLRKFTSNEVEIKNDLMMLVFIGNTDFCKSPCVNNYPR